MTFVIHDRRMSGQRCIIEIFVNNHTHDRYNTIISDRHDLADAIVLGNHLINHLINLKSCAYTNTEDVLIFTISYPVCVVA